MRAGTQVNVNRPRKPRCGCRPCGVEGKADDGLGSERHKHRPISAGVVTLARMEDEESSNTGSPAGGVARTNWHPARDRLGRQGDGWARSTAEAG